MIPAEWNRRDDEFVAWVHGRFGECLFCTNLATDWCHIQHGSSRTSDFLGYPACSDCHHQLDHTPRGRLHTLKQGRVKVVLAEWFCFGLPPLLEAFRLLCEMPSESEVAKTEQITPPPQTGPRQPW